MKYRALERTATLAAAACYLMFLYMDYLAPLLAPYSPYVKYAGLLCCVIIAFDGGERVLMAAMVLTAACDVLLLFTPYFLPGVLIFACAQALHSFRAAQLAQVPWHPLRAALLGLLFAAVLLGLGHDVLYASGALYAAMLLYASALAVWGFVRKRTRQTAVLMVGMLLFCLCDINVALYNLGVARVANRMWLFYLPSQWALAMSGERGAFWRADHLI